MSKILLPLCLVALAACGGDDGDGDGQPDAALPLSPAARVAALEGCPDGDRACVDVVLDALREHMDDLSPICDRRAPFALAYVRITESIRDAVDTEGYFDDPARVIRQDVVFADYYFRAWTAWEAGDLDAVPPSWQAAFEAARDGTVNAAGNIGLGTNAHVQRDLPLVLYEIGSVAADAKADHDLANEVLEPLYGPLIEEAAALYDPIITELPPVPYALLASWREKAWENAAALQAAPDEAARAVIIEEIEAYALEQTELMLRITGSEDPGPRDAHCRETGAGANQSETSQ